MPDIVIPRILMGSGQSLAAVNAPAVFDARSVLVHRRVLGIVLPTSLTVAPFAIPPKAYVTGSLLWRTRLGGHGAVSDGQQDMQETYRIEPMRYFLLAFASANKHKISYINVAPTSAVLPLGSKGGATSTTSPPIRFNPRRPRSSSMASMVVRPPISGVPVPGA